MPGTQPAIRWIPVFKHLQQWGLGLPLAGIFLITGWGKIGAPAEFAAAVQAYQLLPDLLVAVVAAGLPIAELLAGGLLLAGLLAAWLPGLPVTAAAMLCRRWALAMIFLQLVIFLVVLVVTMARGLEIACGCGLLRERTVGWGAVAEDLVLIAVTWLLYRQEQQEGRRP